MDKTSFSVFKPNYRPAWITPNVIIITWFILTLPLTWLLNDGATAGDFLSTFKNYNLILLALVSIYFLAAAYFTYKPLNGRLCGDIVFENDRIIIEDQPFELTTIHNLQFKLLDYHGQKPAVNHGGAFNPQVSQGVDNYVAFMDDTNQTQMIFFKLNTSKHSLELSPFINAAIKAGKIKLKCGIDLLGAENVRLV